MPNAELVQYFDEMPTIKWLGYKPLKQEQTIHSGIDYRYDHQGTFKSNGNEYHNLQVQPNKQAKSANVKGLSRKNGSSPSAACVLVASAWSGVEGVLRAALEQSNDLKSGDGKKCRKIWIHADGTVEPAEDSKTKSDKAAEARKAAKAAKEAGDAKRRADRN